MKSTISKRVESLEKKYCVFEPNFQTIHCPHILFKDEKRPCETCEHLKNKFRICIKYIKPGSKDLSEEG